MKVPVSHQRRRLLVGLAAAALGAATPALAQTQRLHSIRVWRDPGCGCCTAWGAALQRSGHFSLTMQDAPDMAAVKRRLGVPEDLASCHTGEVGDYVIEGHTPLADIMRLLSDRPRHVRGIAVPGMPAGSLGMEMASGRRDAFDVIAFHRDGARSVFARHPAS